MPSATASLLRLFLPDFILENLNSNGLLSLREIGVNNLAGITDSVISIYNEYGIKAAVALNKNEFTYALILPFEILGIKGNINEFSYHIKLNGRPSRPRAIPGTFPDNGGENVNVFKGAGAVSAGNLTSKMVEMMSLMSPTDFWGKYKVAKPSQEE